MALDEKVDEKIGWGELGSGLGLAVTVKALGAFDNSLIYRSYDIAASPLAQVSPFMPSYVQTGVQTANMLYDGLTQVFGFGSGIGLGLAKEKGEYKASTFALLGTFAYSTMQYMNSVGMPFIYAFTADYLPQVLLGAWGPVGVLATVGFALGRLLRRIFRKG